MTPLLDHADDLDDVGDAGDLTSRDGRSGVRHPAAIAAQRWLLTVVRIVLWVFVYVTLILSAWVALGWGVGGWQPVVITSGSMQPTISTGDVLLIDTAAVDTIAQRTIIVFDHAGELIAHRVFAVESDGFTTKGDANTTPDQWTVEPDAVDGVGRLVVPVIGLPVVWWQRGDWIPLGAWSVLMVGAAIRMAVLAEQALTWSRRARRRRGNHPTSHSPAGRAGVQRVRNLVAVLMVAQYAIDADRFGFSMDRLGAVALIAGAVAVLIATNVFATWVERRPGLARAGALIEIGVDTVLVVVLATSTASSGFSWVLFALPIIEAAVRFRLVGALLHWMLLTLVTLAAHVWTGSDGPSSVALEELKTLLDQLSVLFLVVVPAAYLAEQLIGEVATWQRATGHAVDRSQLLVRVADIGRDIVRIDGGHLGAILGGVRSLGFDRADLVVEEGEGRWRIIDGDPLPAPGAPGSCARDGDLLPGGAYVDLDDPDHDDVSALRDAGLSAVLAQVVSDHTGHRVALRAALAGATPLSAELVEAFGLLAGQATVALRNEQLLAEITTIHDELEHQAMHDALTGLPNRVLLLQRLSEAHERGSPTTLYFLDLNGFKPVNDRLGHEAGDRLLVMVAARLRDAVPTADVVARLGGDEFTVLLTTPIDPDDAVAVAIGIADAIREPYPMGNETVCVSSSVGVAFGAPGIAETELIRRADVAMYDAKQGDRRVPYALYRPELDADAERQAALVADLPAAIASGDVSLVFQPVFDVGDAPRLVGAEALVRWRHPAYGDVAPFDVIESARAADLQIELHRSIVAGACAAAAEWRRTAPDRRLFVTVNASPEELGGPGLVGNAVAALETSGLPAELLYVEISERLVSPASETVLENVRSLRELGVGLLLDDFGQGNTSLSYLHELPLDGIKLDRRLVVNSLRSDTDRIVLRSIIELSDRLGHLVVAEGIETAEHLAAITGAGCMLAQGYHLARPLTAVAMLDLVREPGRLGPIAGSGPRTPPGGVEPIATDLRSVVRGHTGLLPTPRPGIPFDPPVRSGS